LVGPKARDEASGVLVLVFGTGFLHPLTPNLDRTVRREKAGGYGTERLDGGSPRVDAPVVVLPLMTQVKKGVSSRACSTALKRSGVLPLVPTR
jgi:hypothetical protein